MKTTVYTLLGWSRCRVAAVAFYTDSDHYQDDRRAALADLCRRLEVPEPDPAWREFAGAVLVANVTMRRRGLRCPVCRAINSRPGTCKKCIRDGKAPKPASRNNPNLRTSTIVP